MTPSTLSDRARLAELPDSVLLARDEVATWLGIRPRQVERLGIPVYALGRKTARYRKGDVVTWLEQQRRAG